MAGADCNEEFALSERFGKWFSEEVASEKGKDFYGYFFIDTQMKPQALFFKFAIENFMYKYNWTGNKFVLDKKIYMPAFLHLIGIDNDNFISAFLALGFLCGKLFKEKFGKYFFFKFAERKNKKGGAALIVLLTLCFPENTLFKFGIFKN